MYTCMYMPTVFSVPSFVEMVRYLFDVEGVKFFLSEHISQDPSEKFFGCQRQRGRVNENPKISDFCKNTQPLEILDIFVEIQQLKGIVVEPNVQ